jgi:hypothetical protein
MFSTIRKHVMQKTLIRSNDGFNMCNHTKKHLEHLEQEQSCIIGIFHSHQQGLQTTAQ